MHILSTAFSVLATRYRRAAFVLLAGGLLGGCGQTQNWNSQPAFVTIGGTVAGLQGTLVLNDNGVDPLTVSGNGAFTFALAIASGHSYAVTVTTQPAGQTCQLSNAQGTTTSNVTNIAVTCAATPRIGGTVSGLSGTLVLENNGADDLTISTNGPFTFATPVAVGGSYSVTVKTQPIGQSCVVTNGSGQASAAVTNVAVACAAFKLRPLPAIYTTGKAINYSPYRAGGPNAGEVPSDADVLQDLGLLQSAGFNLLRLFGADQVADKILNLANQNYPSIKFQVGIYLEGAPSSCVDAVNSAQMATAVSLANKYPNVVAVSVGNETSFAANLPASCLASYVQTVRGQIQQPVTADDDYTFYAGRSASGEKPDLVLPALDFVSIHMYPFTNTSAWDWQQTAVAAGPSRAAAMMAAALQNAQSDYAAVANYSYTTATGQVTTIGASLPITVGETGWKAVATNPAAAIEAITNPAIANPVNAKWYYDLMSSWRGSGAPVNVFWFEAFDEAWKGTDDGWGLWDATRTARYALCGTPAGSACNSTLYSGAGWYH
ncbi:MAG: hypothetical protein KGL34_03160 [Gammaproteobacteria bacterium]|nr:hypothetical protein [Gammaproteobacteria bacterium]